MGTSLAAMTAGITGIMAVVAAVESNWTQFAVEVGSMCVALIAFAWIRANYRVVAPTVLTVAVIAMNVTFTVVDGAGTSSVEAGWLPILVVSAYAIAGRGVGIAAGAIAFLMIAVGTVLHLTGVWPGGTDPLGSAIELALMTAGSLGIVYVFEHYKQAEVDRERRGREDLAVLNAELSAALDEVRELQQKLLESERHDSLQRLAGHFAHDFNNMLTGIMAEVDLATMVVEDAEVREGLENALTSARKAADLTRSMLTYSGRRATRMSEVEASMIFSDVRQLADLSTRHGVEFEVIEDSTPVVRGDTAQIEQALLNLVLNGVQASDHDRPKIELRASFEELGSDLIGAAGTRLRAGAAVRLSVRDYGRGVPAEVADAIFEPYFTTRIEGQGLGLSSVIGIVRGHEGAFTLERLADGTRFSIWLPVAGPVLSRTDLAG